MSLPDQVGEILPQRSDQPTEFSGGEASEPAKCWAQILGCTAQISAICTPKNADQAFSPEGRRDSLVGLAYTMSILCEQLASHRTILTVSDATRLSFALHKVVSAMDGGSETHIRAAKKLAESAQKILPKSASAKLGILDYTNYGTHEITP